MPATKTPRPSVESEPNPWVGAGARGLWDHVSPARRARATKNSADALAISQALAVENHDEALRVLEQASASMVDMREDGGAGESLLHKACLAGSACCVRKLLSMGANPLAPRPAPAGKRPGFTALARAAQSGSVECIQALALACPNDLPALFSEGDPWGRNPALVAASRGNAPALRAILDIFPPSAAGVGAGQTAMMCACSGDSAECLDVLWRQTGADTKWCAVLDGAGIGAFGRAVVGKKTSCVQWFVDQARALLDSNDPRARSGAKDLFACSSLACHPLVLAASGGVSVFDAVASVAFGDLSSSARQALVDACEPRAAAGSPVRPRLAALRQAPASAGPWRKEASPSLAQKLASMRARSQGADAPARTFDAIAGSEPSTLAALADQARRKMALVGPERSVKLPREGKSSPR
jgi:hypothetical protein